MAHRKRASSESTLSNIVVADPSSADATTSRNASPPPHPPPKTSTTTTSRPQLTAAALAPLEQQFAVLPNPSAPPPPSSPPSIYHPHPPTKAHKNRKMAALKAHQGRGKAPPSPSPQPPSSEPNKVTHHGGEPTTQDKRTMRDLRDNPHNAVVTLLARYRTLVIRYPTAPQTPPTTVSVEDAETLELAVAITGAIEGRLAKMKAVPQERKDVRKKRDGAEGERDQERLVYEALKGGWIEVTGFDGMDGEENLRARATRPGEGEGVAFDFLDPLEDEGEDVEGEAGVEVESEVDPEDGLDREIDEDAGEAHGWS